MLHKCRTLFQSNLPFDFQEPADWRGKPLSSNPKKVFRISNWEMKQMFEDLKTVTIYFSFWFFQGLNHILFWSWTIFTSQIMSTSDNALFSALIKFVTYIKHAADWKSADRSQWRIQDFPQGGAPTPKIAIIFSKFCWKLHENERIWTPRGGRVPGAPPWIRQWKCLRKYQSKTFWARTLTICCHPSKYYFQ